MQINKDLNLDQSYSHVANGFTLIELMVAVAILGILVSVALPSYQKYIVKSRRAEAMAELSKAQTTLERCYAANFTYAGTCSPPASTTTPNGFYTITSTGSATTYTFTATASGIQAADTSCFTMSIDQASQKSAADTGGTPQPQCWNR